MRNKIIKHFVLSTGFHFNLMGTFPMILGTEWNLFLWAIIYLDMMAVALI